MNHLDYKISPHGGRVKSAAIGIDFLDRNCEGDPVLVNKRINELRKDPPEEYLKAFFPYVKAVRQRVRGIGLYRPILKTDQGMAGNFLPFYTNGTFDSDCVNIADEEGIAIPEIHADLSQNVISKIQEKFHQLELQDVFELLDNDSNSFRRAEKGRGKFFFIRPAKTIEPLVIGAETHIKVEKQVNALLHQISVEAQNLEQIYKQTKGIDYRSGYEGDRLIYCQPDVFIDKSNNVKVEKINCPDVGMFLTNVDTGGYAKIFPEIRNINTQLTHEAMDALCEHTLCDVLHVITRDEVLLHEEDVLEIHEMETIDKFCQQRSVRLIKNALQDVISLKEGSSVLLLNLDMNAANIDCLLERHCKGQLNCFPNPFFKIAASKLSGLETQIIDGNVLEKFLELADSNPTCDRGIKDIHCRLQRILLKNESDIIHVDLGKEIVPILRSSLHSFKQVVTRIKRLESKPSTLLLKYIPINKQNAKIMSNTGPRLHAFRFMCISPQK